MNGDIVPQLNNIVFGKKIMNYILMVPKHLKMCATTFNTKSLSKAKPNDWCNIKYRCLSLDKILRLWPQPHNPWFSKWHEFQSYPGSLGIAWDRECEFLVGIQLKLMLQSEHHDPEHTFSSLHSIFEEDPGVIIAISKKKVDV